MRNWSVTSRCASGAYANSVAEIRLVTVAVTISRRTPGMVGRRRVPGGRKRARPMFDKRAVKPDVNAVSRFAFAAGITGNLAMIPVAPFLGKYLGSMVR